MVSGGHVLIIEDDDVLRLLETLSLERSGWEVSEASTGMAGVAAAVEKLPDVIICDRKLPDLDGLRVIASLASEALTASIPVVLVTGMGEADDIIDGMAAGAHDYLVKPFRMVELEIRCRAALRVSREHRLLVRSEHELRVIAAALTESEKAYRRIVDLAAEGVCVVDRDKTITFANARMGDLLGVVPAALVGRSMMEFTDDEGREIEMARVARYRAGAAESGDSKFVRPDGTCVWTSFNAAPIFDDDGVFQGSIALICDVTQRHHHEEALARSEARYRAAFDLAPVGMAQIGLDSRFLRVNPALCEMLGYSAAELLAMMPVDISHPDDAADASRAIAELIADSIKHFRVEKRYIRADGETVWSAVSATPVYDIEGHVDHLLVHYLDISELKAVETALQHLAMHDPLTGLLNRRGFDEALRRHVAHTRRYGPTGAVLVVDIDGLKAINDTRGHEAGDRAIESVAGLLRHRLRSTDTIARLGGDEFAVICPHADRDQAGGIAAALVEAIRGLSVAADPGRAVTVSIGVATFPSGNQSPESIMSEADGALYAAKSAGRDQWALSASQPPTSQPLTSQPPASQPPTCESPICESPICEPTASMASAMNRARNR